MDTPLTSLAALNLELVPEKGNTVPSEAHLLFSGSFRAADGRPREVSAWQLDSAIACAVILRAGKKQGDILIDYEHQSLRSEQNGQPAPAAGWFKALEWREGKGLFATGIAWTNRARELIAAREYRYISAVFTYNPKNGEVVEILSVALTNTPALDGLDALIAACGKSHQTPGASRHPLSKEGLQTEEIEMPDESIAALTVERDGLKTQVAALTTQVAALTAERDDALKKLADMESATAAALLAREKEEHAAVLEAACKAGIVPPTERVIYEKMTLADLKLAVEARKPAALLNPQADGKAPTAALSKEEAEVAAKFGLTHEQFLKAKE
jgi:phage I-like protein